MIVGSGRSARYFQSRTLFIYAMLTQVNPIHAMAPLSISATIAGYDCAVGKYAWNFGLCQWVTCGTILYQFIEQSLTYTSVIIALNQDQIRNTVRHSWLLTPGIITLSISAIMFFHSSGLCGASEGKSGFMYPGSTVGKTLLKVYIHDRCI